MVKSRIGSWLHPKYDSDTIYGSGMGGVVPEDKGVVAYLADSHLLLNVMN